jgi:dihydropteroate synthase
MGVVNVTPDSFSDGGRYASRDAAISHGRSLMAAGADILDIGGESTRPGATPVSVGEELDRVVPVVAALAEEGALVSIDTRRATVLRTALTAGARIVNDVTALAGDPEGLAAVAESSAAVVLMHMQGDPHTMQQDPTYATRRSTSTISSQRGSPPAPPPASIRRASRSIPASASASAIPTT